MTSSWHEAEADAAPTWEEEFGDEWSCHDCGAGGRTPWDPTEGCPRHPCHAFKKIECATCPICTGWIL